MMWSLKPKGFTSVKGDFVSAAKEGWLQSFWLEGLGGVSKCRPKRKIIVICFVGRQNLDLEGRAKLFLVNYNALLDRETKLCVEVRDQWCAGLRTTQEMELTFSRTCLYWFLSYRPLFYFQKNLVKPLAVILLLDGIDTCYQSGQSSTFPHCPSGTRGKRNYPSSYCLGNLFVEDSDSLPCKNSYRARNY